MSINKNLKKEEEKEIDYKYEFNNLLTKRVGFPIGVGGFIGINSIVETTYSKVKLFSDITSLEGIYFAFIKDIENIPLESFSYPDLINLLYTLSNSFILLSTKN